MDAFVMEVRDRLGGRSSPLSEVRSIGVGKGLGRFRGVEEEGLKKADKVD